jgi:uncharacterized protein
LSVEITVWICAVAIGTIIGLLGGGGAILAMPVMVYLMGYPPKVAAAYSLFVVGVVAFFGSIRHIRRKEISFQSILYFALPGMSMSFLTRRYIVPQVPDKIATLGELVITKDLLIMVLFAFIMLIAGWSMLRKIKDGPRKRLLPIEMTWLAIGSWGLVVGFISGMVGAGGGFMIIPILVVLMELPIKTAMGTSLAIITIQSLTGFSGDILAQTPIDWGFIMRFTAFAMLGMWAGSTIAQKSKPEKLKKAFGVFVMLMGLLIVIMEMSATD